MAKQTINLGSGDSRGDGESIRTAFDKCNDNFSELYADISALDGSKIVYGDLSVTTASASGAGSLSYNSSTGVFTFTPAAAVGNIFDQDLNTTDAVQFTDVTLDATLTFDNGTRSWVTNVTDDTLVGGTGDNAILLMEPNGSIYNAIAPNNTRIDLGVDPNIDGSGTLQWGNIYLDTTSAITFGDGTAQTTAWTGTITESQISDLSHTAYDQDLNTTDNVTFANINLAGQGSFTPDGSGNISITANNYITIDSANDGQIQIGTGTGIGAVVIGHANKNIALRNSLTFPDATVQTTAWTGTITESQISDLSHFSGAYADLTGKPTIPSDIGDLTDTGSLLTSGTPLTQIKTETGDYTLTSNDHGYYIRMNNSGNATVTLVADSVEAIPVGTTIVVGRTTANSVEFAAGAGATVYSPASLVIAEQWAKVTVLKVAANTWEIEGNLAP
jgi:hypothetical protein